MNKILSLIKRVITLALIAIVKFYKLVISPWTPSSCRHVPTCSSYAIEALQKHGPVKGLWLSVKRLSKCHPWGTSGYDPVPKTKTRIKVEKLKI
ncbi:MAG: membrane protein insertion efficiency factor YidD [Bacteroidota bacterium]|nr:membrane protein insertion efficiency factor YidD [Bacteroidota bacterium]